MTGDRSNCGELKTNSDSLHLTQLKQDLKHGQSRNGAPGPAGRMPGGGTQIFASMKYLIGCKEEGGRPFSVMFSYRTGTNFCVKVLKH